MLKTIQKDMDLVHKMISACDRYLTDPDNPDEYFLGARGNEIDVVYNTIDEEGKVNNQQKKASLQSLLDAVEGSDRFIVMSLSSKHSDPRDLLLKSADKFEKTAKMIMEAVQKLEENNFKNKAMRNAGEEGGTVTFEETVKELTKRVVIASRGNENQKLAEIAELPELK